MTKHKQKKRTFREHFSTNATTVTATATATMILLEILVPYSVCFGFGIE